MSRTPAKRKRGDVEEETPRKRSRPADLPVRVPDTIKVDVAAFGNGEMGQLGVFNAQNQMSMKRVHPGPVYNLQGVNVRDVYSYGYQSTVVLGNGTVLSWGVNDDFVLGRPAAEADVPSDADASASEDQADHSDPTDPARPSPIPNLSNVSYVTGGEFHMAALTTSGELYSWGKYKNADGWFGFKPGQYGSVAKEPVLHEFFAKNNITVVQIASGANATYALTSTGDLYAWGAIRQALAKSHVSLRQHPDAWLTPKLLMAPKATRVWAGGYHMFMKDREGKIFGWGLNNRGQLGFGFDNEENKERPEHVEGLSGLNIQEMSLGDYHSLAMTEDGRVLSFGFNSSGQLGFSIRTGADGQPEVYEAPHVADDSDDSMDLEEEEKKEKKPEGEVETKEMAEEKKAEIEKKAEEKMVSVYMPIPTYIPFFERLHAQGERVIAIAAGTVHSLVLTSNSRLFAFGMGEGHRLGTDDTASHYVPFQVTGQSIDNRNLLRISAGADFGLIAVASKEGDEKTPVKKTPTKKSPAKH